MDRDDAAELVDPPIDPRRGTDVVDEELGFVEEVGGDVDEALIDAQDDDVDEQGHPVGAAAAGSCRSSRSRHRPSGESRGGG